MSGHTQVAVLFVAGGWNDDCFGVRAGRLRLGRRSHGEQKCGQHGSVDQDWGGTQAIHDEPWQELVHEGISLKEWWLNADAGAKDSMSKAEYLETDPFS
jgi:hypothetical protein